MHTASTICSCTRKQLKGRQLPPAPASASSLHSEPRLSRILFVYLLCACLQHVLPSLFSPAIALRNTTQRGIIASKMVNAQRTQMRIRISSAIATCNLQPPSTAIAMHRKSNCARLQMKFNTRSAALHKFCTYPVYKGYARLGVH